MYPNINRQESSITIDVPPSHLNTATAATAHQQLYNHKELMGSAAVLTTNTRHHQQLLPAKPSRRHWKFIHFGVIFIAITCVILVLYHFFWSTNSAAEHHSFALLSRPEQCSVPLAELCLSTSDEIISECHAVIYCQNYKQQQQLLIEQQQQQPLNDSVQLPTDHQQRPIALKQTMQRPVIQFLPVIITVFYETHCPDSKEFITQQLHPTFGKLQQQPGMIDYELVPFGKAFATRKIDGDWSFECQHGPRECMGNTIQSCAIHFAGLSNKGDKFLSATERQTKLSMLLSFIACMEDALDPNAVAASCGAKFLTKLPPVFVDDLWPKIAECAKGSQGRQLLAAMANKTMSFRPDQPQLSWVPTIMLNHRYTRDNQWDATTDLMSLVCRLYQGPKPVACNSAGGGEQPLNIFA